MNLKIFLGAENPLDTSLKGKPALCFEKMNVYVYNVTYCQKDKLKDGKKF